MGFTRLVSDFGVYVKGDGNNRVYLALYVDDLFIVSKRIEWIREVKKMLNQEFKMKDLGEACFLLGMEIRRLAGGDVFVVQEKYAKSVVARFGMDKSKPASTPLEPGSKLSMKQKPESEAERELMACYPYREAIGSLTYLMTVTRPDLGAAVSILSRFSQDPGMAHWEGVKRVLRYVHGSTDVGLLYKKGSQVSTWGYADVIHSSEEEARGPPGYVFMSGGAAISWRSSLLEVITHSSCESEYVALSGAANEGVYLRKLQGELGIKNVNGGTLIVGDNESCQKLAENPVFHRRSKHILVKFHSVREHVKHGRIVLQQIGTKAMGADIMTKCVSVGVLKENMRLIGMSRGGVKIV